MTLVHRDGAGIQVQQQIVGFVVLLLLLMLRGVGRGGLSI